MNMIKGKDRNVRFEKREKRKEKKRKRERMENGDVTTIEHKAYARVGLLGNPSDVYNGKTISFTLSNFYASVILRPSLHLIIQPHPTHDLVTFDSHHQLVYSSSFPQFCMHVLSLIIHLSIYLLLCTG